MRVSIHNLGRLTHAEIDLKPLTVLVGPNNAGKTWLAYLLAGILGDYGYLRYMAAYEDDEIVEPLPFVDALVEDVLAQGNASIDLVQFIHDQAETCVNQVALFARTWLSEYLGTNRMNFENLEVTLQLAENKKGLQDFLVKSSWNYRLAFGSDSKEKPALLTVRKKSNEHKLYFYTSGEAKVITSQLPLSIIKEFIGNIFLRELFHAIYQGIYLFPTERTTFIGFPFEEEKNIQSHVMSEAEISELESSAKRQPYAIGSFLEATISFYRSSLARRKKAAQKDKNIQCYMALADILQTQILGGRLDFSAPDPEPGREILFTPIQGSEIALEMPVASSMVKELAPLVLYLRYRAQSRELIIIDEPEMNLHPEAQTKMIEFLAMLVNADLHVLITTHSPYIVDHLENLMTASEHPRQAAAIRKEFFLQNTDAFIAKDKVAVYLVDQGKAVSLFQEDGHIHWDTFSSISDKVGGFYSRLLEESEEDL